MARASCRYKRKAVEARLKTFTTNFAGAKSQKSRKVAEDEVAQDVEVQHTSSGSRSQLEPSVGREEAGHFPVSGWPLAAPTVTRILVLWSSPMPDDLLIGRRIAGLRLLPELVFVAMLGILWSMNLELHIMPYYVCILCSLFTTDQLLAVSSTVESTAARHE
eukprot:scpid103459/ scgid29357/ 